ncbi:hypothetical protein [Chryseolinea sp. H1M3-3]|uniref:hypothetical protein n=1 Tax=Chryseolinea sp. H1M3-3 TaxID=3034144 RepID=UPI0023EBEF17|nr:hypothetical protein [Chryseolinea sp. H1M3-3]
MNDILERPLKELFAAVFHNHQKQDSLSIRADQEKVLNELLNQPPDFRNKVLLTPDGLEVFTQKGQLQYIHSDSVDSRIIKLRKNN